MSTYNIRFQHREQSELNSREYDQEKVTYDIALINFHPFFFPEVGRTDWVQLFTKFVSH